MSANGRGSHPNRSKDISRDSATFPHSPRIDQKAPDLSHATTKLQRYEADGLASPRKKKISPSTAPSTASGTAQTSPRHDSRSTLASTSTAPSPPDSEGRGPKSSSSSPRTPKDKSGVLPLSPKVSQPYRHDESDLVSPKFSSKQGRTLMQGPKLGTAGSSTGMVLARNTKQTMRSDTFVHCYRINDSSRDRQHGSKDATDPMQEGPVRSLIHSISELAQVGVLTDYRTYLILFSRSKDCKAQLGALKDEVSLTKCDLPPVQWCHILQFLHSTESPNEQHYKNVLLNVVDVVVGQWRSSRGPWTTKVMSLPLFEVQGKTTKAIEGSATKNGKQSVATVMQNYRSYNAGNLHGLEHYLKGLRIQVTQPRMQSPSNKSQLQKTIVGLARPDDGHRSGVSSPPRVTKFGAGSNDVSFYFKASSHDRENATVASNKLHSQYITVAQYFVDHNHQKIKEPGLPLVNVGTRSKPTYYPPELCELVISPDSKNCSALSFGEVTGIVGTANVPKLINSYGGKCEIRFPGLKMSIANSLSECQVSIKPQSLHLPSRVRFSPEIVYSPKNATDTSSGTWNDDSVTLSPCKDGLKVAVLLIGPKQWLENGHLSQNVENLRSRLKTRKIPLDSAEEPKKIEMAHLKFDQGVQNKITSVLGSLVQSAGAVLVVLPSKMKSLYAYVECQCDIKFGIRSICFICPKFVGENRSILHLALKLNLKTGGQNKALKSVKRKILSLEETMVVGVQIVLPPTQAVSNAKGFIATVASSGGALSHWPAHVQVLDNKPFNEVFLALLQDRVQVWKTQPKNPDGTQNGAQPQRQKQERDMNIVIYHSGPAHKACFEAISALKKQYSKVKVTLIEVFQDHQADVQLPLSLQDATNEVKRSTVIIRTMEAEKTWEFLLHGHTTGKHPWQSKAPPKKKTLPVRYSVVHDDIFSSTKAGDGAREELEDLTHDMSYLAGCPTSVVSSTLPIYYVGLLCNRIHSYVRPWYHPKPQSESEDKSKVEPVKPMTQDVVTVHSRIKDSMFYI